MKEKLILALAYDGLLLELDEEYEGVPAEHIDLLKAKLFEEYGFKVTSAVTELTRVQQEVVVDVRKMRDELIGELTKGDE